MGAARAADPMSPGEPIADARLDPVTLAERLQAACVARGLTVATAESCTGGALATAITDIPGSSGYFRGAIVAYADDVKAGTLGVDPAVIAAHGAVSAQVAVAMAAGVRDRLGVSVAVSITGVAGPDGGTEEKPVGLTYLGLADASGTDVRRHHWTGDRAANRSASVVAALEWLTAWAEAQS